MTPSDPNDLAKRLARMASTTETSGPVHVTEDEGTGHQFLIYSTDSGLRIQLRFDGDGLWMSQGQIAELFGVNVRTVNEHIQNIYSEGELEEHPTIRKFRIVRIEGLREVARDLTHHNLDVVIAVGYRVSSRQGTMFRKWATGVLVQFATKGFVIDVQRLKDPAARDYFRELREAIREIRASEANVYRELRDILALCSDYAALAAATKTEFFATVQNKLLYAVSNMTGPELRLARARAGMDNMGLATWGGRNVKKFDTKVAKNYLGELEIKDLNRFTNMLLDYFEQETDLRRLVVTADAEKALNRFIRNNERPLLSGPGSTSTKAADDHCEAEYDKFTDLRKRNYLQSDDEA